MTNPNKDPWKAELILWVGLMYGGDSLAQQAKKVIDHYGWTEYTTEFMAGVLSSISNIANVTKRIAAFYSRLDNPDGLTISQDDLDRFGWSTPTQEEADRVMAAFELFGITSRESMIQFIAIAAAESGYGLEFLEMGDDAYWESHGYNRNTRGAGYIQVTHDYNHRAFLDFIGDDYSGADTASYIAENYPLEVSVWFWSQLNLYGYEGGVNEFIETKTEESGDPLLIFLKTAYYVGGMPGGSFNSDINDAIAGKADYTITDDYLIINGNQYPLPSRWKIRLEAYEKAQGIW